MILYSIVHKRILFLLLTFLVTSMAFSQLETSKWKAQIGLGVNHAFSDGFVDGFEAKSINFPTVNLGIQHMFSRQFGAKLDYGFNRISNESQTPEFKLNYSRINAQAVYDPTSKLRFLPAQMGVVTHAGPGYSFVKPLGVYADNDLSFFNVMAGFEVHYGVTQLMTIYSDVSYIYGFAKDFNPMATGYGAFNGNLLTVTLGVSFSLSGCYYCD
ncbi:hypothetical protein IA57_07105 [Mangrovimonas yunxiaonensis]|uniref:Uncharacterized protein n=1 Tax=Mangrovimonas yunxiaonensis TaxID=1197477 RepID=A0A084TLK4_9FLAO|nr:outer membrane beta-barrel protein [Mangrovimonas yunxiaonensis]KFB01590.1 hypothetical protein IA57_07105 [Mangrovimonas yunxiaonensis]MBR9756797.1 outer membrane beta-barrel protein [Algicola sp.]GGH35781.1 hypothetical protein GCM10011364_02580 [Mangrovimonas yunxiaonensis]